MPDHARRSQKKTARANLERAFALEGPKEARAFYDRWAGDYDQDVQEGFGSRIADLAALLAERHLQDISGQVLDIGCGTGLTGVALRRFGDWPLDGLDISPGMLARADARGIYEQLIVADLSRALQVADGFYAAAVSSGTFTRGHVGADALEKIVRVLEPGAPFIFSVHEGVWKSGGFDETLRRLESVGRIRVTEKERHAHIAELPDQASLICVTHIS